MDSLLSGFSNIELPYYQLPSAVPSLNTSSILSSFAAMPRSSSAEPGKTTKRKGARSVSTLSPTQLARKRANDREAQRAIRARTKEHIERLEAEVEELKSQHSADTRVQELMRRNLALENENRRLKGEIGGSNSNSNGGPPPPSVAVTQAVGNIAATGSPYSTGNVYEDSLTTASGMPSPRTSPFSSADYSPLPDATSYAGAYMSIPSHHPHAHPHAHHHHHPHAHHSHQVGGPSSTVSSPTSATTDPDYITAAGPGAAAPTAPAYIPTSIPTSMQQHAPSLMTPAHPGLAGSSTPPPGSMAFQSPQAAPPQQQPQSSGQQQQQWNNMYGSYYGRQVQSPVH